MTVVDREYIARDSRFVFLYKNLWRSSDGGGTPLRGFRVISLWFAFDEKYR